MREPLIMRARRVQIVRRRGNEVLRILYEEPQGACRAMQHMRTLIEALRQYAATTLAEEQAEGDVLQRRRYEIRLREERAKRYDLLVLTAVLQINGQTVRENSLVTRWDKEGAYQLRPRRVSVARRKRPLA